MTRYDVVEMEGKPRNEVKASRRRENERKENKLQIGKDDRGMDGSRGKGRNGQQKIHERKGQDRIVRKGMRRNEGRKVK